MLNDVRLDIAAIISTMVESVLYGLSLYMFGEVWRTISFKRLSSSRNYRMNCVMLVAACLFFILGTTVSLD